CRGNHGHIGSILDYLCVGPGLHGLRVPGAALCLGVHPVLQDGGGGGSVLLRPALRQHDLIHHGADHRGFGDQLLGGHIGQA
ncbi:Immunity protein 17, partial [Dysosmobacter welbionis]